MVINSVSESKAAPVSFSESPRPLVIHKIKPVKRLTPAEKTARLEILLGYIKLGFAVVPLRPSTKTPCLKGWCSDKIINTERRLRLAFAKWSHCNWGIVTGECSGVFIVDVDKKDGGYESLQELEEKYGKFPVTPTQRTGGGGMTFLFKNPPGVRIKGSQSEIAPGIDIRGWHNQFAVSPSIHKSGNDYTWILHPATTPPAEPPEWLVEQTRYPDDQEAGAEPLSLALANEIRERIATVYQVDKNRDAVDKWVAAAVRNECERVAMAPPHTGNITLFKAACNLGGIVAAGLLATYDMIAALLQECNARGGSTRGAKAQATINSALRRTTNSPRYPKDYFDNHDATANMADETDEVSQEVDPEVEAVLAAEYEHQQRDPEGFARWCDEQIERQRRGERTTTRGESAVQQVNRWKVQLDHELREKAEQGLDLDDDLISSIPLRSWHSFVQCNSDHIGTEAGCDLEVEEQEREEERKQQLPEPLPGTYRCKECWKADNRCDSCRNALSNRSNMCALRESNGHGRCYRGNTPLLVHKTLVKACAMTLPCNCVGCPDCGPAIEEDHRLHFVTMVSEMEKGSSFLRLPNQSIHSTETTPVEIQRQIAVVRVPCIYREGYAEKLGRLMNKGQLWYFDGYSGLEQSTFFIMMTPNFDSKKLKYKPKRRMGYSAFEFNLELIDYAEFFTQVTYLAHEHGRSIRLAKSAFEMCDKPFGARNSHNRWNWCSALRPSKRSEPSKQWKLYSLRLVPAEMVPDLAEKIGIAINEVDRKRFDKGYLKGRTPYVVKVLSFIPTNASGTPIDEMKWEDATPRCIDKLYRFLDALARKNVETIPSVPLERTHVAPSEKGGSCFYTQSLF